MRLKKYVSVFVAAAMLIAVFAGCGKENSAENTQEGNGYVETTVEGVSVRVNTEGGMYVDVRENGDVRLTDAKKTKDMTMVSYGRIVDKALYNEFVKNDVPADAKVDGDRISYTEESTGISRCIFPVTEEKYFLIIFTKANDECSIDPEDIFARYTVTAEPEQEIPESALAEGVS